MLQGFHACKGACWCITTVAAAGFSEERCSSLHAQQPPSQRVTAVRLMVATTHAAVPLLHRCTAVTAVVVGDRLLVANVGDSRAVLSRKGTGEAIVCSSAALLSPTTSFAQELVGPAVL